ncbi:MAG TPA: hypothetical protein VJ570_01865 [Holophagaceae bacterium]|nr:hypothetical protein [Holophagaceae bacterium]
MDDRGWGRRVLGRLRAWLGGARPQPLWGREEGLEGEVWAQLLDRPDP